MARFPPELAGIDFFFRGVCCTAVDDETLNGRSNLQIRIDRTLEFKKVEFGGVLKGEFSDVIAYSTITALPDARDQELLKKFPTLDRFERIHPTQWTRPAAVIQFKGPDPMGQKLSSFKVTAQVNEFNVDVLIEFENMAISALSRGMKYVYLLDGWEVTATVDVSADEGGDA